MSETKEQILRDHYKEIGAKGGKVSHGGGRPRVPDDQLTPLQRKRRQYNDAYKAKKRTTEGVSA